MSDSKSTSGGITFLSLLAIAFIVLKLCKVINWSWWWVTCPLWGPVAISIIVVSILTVIKRRKEKDELDRAESGYNKEAWENGGKSKWQQRLEEMQKQQENQQKFKDNK